MKHIINITKPDCIPQATFSAFLLALQQHISDNIPLSDITILFYGQTTLSSPFISILLFFDANSTTATPLIRKAHDDASELNLQFDAFSFQG